uniref:Uncharacterized protein n=1 Tax=Rhizophora mucronata TaxID=61149 RepID=A0A2P2PY90_RHIMU
MSLWSELVQFLTLKTWLSLQLFLF